MAIVRYTCRHGWTDTLVERARQNHHHHHTTPHHTTPHHTTPHTTHHAPHTTTPHTPPHPTSLPPSSLLPLPHHHHLRSHPSDTLFPNALSPGLFFRLLHNVYFLCSPLVCGASILLWNHFWGRFVVCAVLQLRSCQFDFVCFRCLDGAAVSSWFFGSARELYGKFYVGFCQRRRRCWVASRESSGLIFLCSNCVDASLRLTLRC